MLQHLTAVLLLATVYAQCPTDVRKVSCTTSNCYYLAKTSNTQSNAQAACTCRGYQLASLKGTTEANAIKNSEDTFAWVGVKKTPVSPCGFVRNLTLAGKAVCDGIASGVLFSAIPAYLTQGHDKTGIGVPLCRLEGCGSSNVGNCLKYGATPTNSWYEARNYCLGIGGDLFFLTKADNDSFTVFLETMSKVVLAEPLRLLSLGKMLYWAGIIYNKWTWSADNTDVFYSNWGAGQPDSDDCVVVNTANGKWKTVPCTSSYNVLCSGPPDGSTATPKPDTPAPATAAPNTAPNTGPESTPTEPTSSTKSTSTTKGSVNGSGNKIDPNPVVGQSSGSTIPKEFYIVLPVAIGGVIISIFIFATVLVVVRYKRGSQGAQPYDRERSYHGSGKDFDNTYSKNIPHDNQDYSKRLSTVRSISNYSYNY